MASTAYSSTKAEQYAKQMSLSMRLTEVLHEILAIDRVVDKKPRDYDQRTTLVYKALALASEMGMPCGIRFDSTEQGGQEWPVVSLTLPTGQVAWHCKATAEAYDGHTDDTKAKRIEAYVPRVFPAGIIPPVTKQ